MKTYILQKDTPVSKAGEKVKKTALGYNTESGEYYTVTTVENNPEWFKPEKSKKEKDLADVQGTIDSLKELRQRIFRGDVELTEGINLDIHCPAYECGASNGYREYKRTGENYIAININLQEL